MTKMYNFRYGVVDVIFTPGKCIQYSIDEGKTWVTHLKDGKYYENDKYPTLISLEQAEKQGLVRKKPTRLRVKYKSNFSRCNLTSELYRDKSEFLSDCGYSGTTFVSFVDDKLNECDPPQLTIEWEECE